jgi:hypothetical protein
LASAILFKTIIKKFFYKTGAAGKMAAKKNYCRVLSANASASQRGRSKEDGQIYRYFRVMAQCEVIA